MTDENDKGKATSKQQIEAIAAAMRKALVVYLDAGYSPGSLAGGLMIVIYNLMKAQEMSEMQISNELNRIVDRVREMAFVENKKLN